MTNFENWQATLPEKDRVEKPEDLVIDNGPETDEDESRYTIKLDCEKCPCREICENERSYWVECTNIFLKWANEQTGEKIIDANKEASPIMMRADIPLEKLKELEKDWMEQSKHGVLVKVDKVHLHDAETFFNQFSTEKCKPVEAAAGRMAQAMERKMFEVMTECRSSVIYVVGGHPSFDGSVGRWEVELTCDKDEAQRIAKRCGVNFTEHDLTNLLNGTDEEFEEYVGVCEAHGDKNSDVVRKWRETLKGVDNEKA